MENRLQAYDFIVFDFDGLLVNTEHLHFQAYQKMCMNRGCVLPWDFARYCQIAHTSSEGLKKEIYAEFPSLYQKEPDWAVLYAEKKRAYEQLLLQGEIELMPGVDKCLSLLQEYSIRSCVVTNSFRNQIDQIYKQIPLLQKIPHQITREDYVNPKPAPDAYIAALNKHARPGDRIIGFEDTIRGLKALQAAGIEGVVISQDLSSQSLKEVELMRARHYSSFIEWLSG